MNTERVKRKLSAIFSADVEGYSRLMGDDEAATVRTLEAYRKVLTDLVEEHRGRVVDSPGDNLLAEFGSVVDAVQCAVEVQQILKAKNAELPENRRMQFRIGVNLGDVIQEGERIYGDGVNIAARIEGLADGGGICVSGSAYEQIENKLALGYEYFGEHTVKNITKPIKVYKVPMEPGVGKKKAGSKGWKKAAIAAAVILILGGGVFAVWHSYLRPTSPPAEVASEKTPASESPDETLPPLPDEPSIAVLPFANISGDPKEDYLSDGITEQIITALSKIPKMLVIARNSVFTYKGKPVMVQQVSEELGVRYVLEGSVQKSGDRLRVTAQLIDAKTGNHLWSERYDRDLKDLFELQDDITKNVITALQVKLTQGQAASVLGEGTKNLDAYLKVMKGTHHFFRMNSNDNEIAREFFKEAIDLDLNYAQAYVLLAWTYFHDAIFGWAKTPAKSYEKAVELAKKAISVDEQNASAYMVLANVYAKTGQFEKAVVIGKKALSLDPALNYFYGFVLYNVGQFNEAIPFLKKAIRMDPKPQSFHLAVLGLSYFKARQFKEAIQFLEKAISIAPKPPSWYLAQLGASYNRMGQFNEGIQFLMEAIRIDPRPPSWYLFSLGWAYFWTGQNEKAVAVFNKSVSRNPQNDFLHASLGCALNATGKPEEAVEMFEKALNLNPRPPSWYIGDLAIARLGTGKSEEAITTMRELISRRPDDSNAYRGLSTVLTFQRKYEEAVSMAKKSISLKSPVEAVAYFYLGAPYLMIGEYEEAIAAFKRSINLWPEYIHGNIGLTASYSVADRMEEARAQAAEVAKINPKFSLKDVAENGAVYSFQKADKERFINALRKAGLK